MPGNLTTVTSRLLTRARTLPRTLGLLAVASGAVLSLAACEVKPGAAAFVGDERITEAEVAGYVTPTATASPDTSGQSLTPRAQVVSTLVSTSVFRAYLGKQGGVPDAAALAASRDAAFTTVTGQAAPNLDTFRKNLEGIGFAARFIDVYVTQVELEYEAIQRSKATSLAELVKAVSASSPAPKVSPRYGSWQASSLALAGSTSTPAYLTLAGGTGA